MALSSNPNSKDFSLMQNQAAQRAMVAKMRTKLAGGSVFDHQMAEKRRIASHKKAFTWGSLLGIGAIVVLANLAYLGYKHESKVMAATKRAHILPAPKATLSNEDQALYWAYALYDFNLHMKRFGTPVDVVVDASKAKAKLQELLPKIDARTRFIINGYLPQARRNT